MLSTIALIGDTQNTRTNTCPSESGAPVRMQSTQIGSIVSSKERTVCSVPQGSVLGQRLFLIFVNDVHFASKKFDFYLFAEDTNYYMQKKI